MRAGDLTQRVTIERLQEGQDEAGQPITTWVPLTTTWAAVEPLNGREYFAADAAASEVTTRIRIRYRPGLTSADRVNHDGALHNILAIINPRSRGRELVLMCKLTG